VSARRFVSPTSLLVGCLAGLAAVAFIVEQATAKTDQLPVRRPAFAVPYDGRLIDDELEALIVASDGQAFATLARDPTLARADVEFGRPAEGAYRAQRPLLPWLAWAGSLGRPGWVPPALAVLFVLAVAAATALVAELLADGGSSRWIAPAILILPGMYAAAEYFGPEPLGLALGLAGLLRVRRYGYADVGGLALMALAGLARETMLLLPAGLAVHALAQRRVADAVRLAATAIPYLVWVVVLRLRVGAWSLGSSLGGRMSLRLEGLDDVIAGRSELPDADRFFLAVTAGLLLLCVVRRPRSALTAAALAFGLFSVFLGSRVWAEWVFFGRVLLPAHVLAILALLERPAAPAPSRRDYGLGASRIG
jgi:hypothetical protein